jgi:recombination protein RecT
MDNELILDLTNQLDVYEKKVFNDLLKNHNISGATFKQLILSEIKKSYNMQIAFQTNPTSLFASVVLCAQLGLMPSSQLGQFYFSVDKSDAKGYYVNPIIGYQGLISILLRSGEIISISGESVHEGDIFEYELGLNPILKHIPEDPIRNAFTLTHVYCVATFKNGTKSFKVMTRGELLATINMQKVKSDFYFNDIKDSNHWMLKKIVLKQLAKFLPKDYSGTLAVNTDNALEGGNLLDLDEENNVIVTKLTTDKKEKSMFGDVDLD